MVMILQILNLIQHFIVRNDLCGFQNTMSINGVNTTTEYLL